MRVATDFWARKKLIKRMERFVRSTRDRIIGFRAWPLWSRTIKTLRPTHRSAVGPQFLIDVSLQSIWDNKRRFGDDELVRAGDAAGSAYLRVVGRNCSMLCITNTTAFISLCRLVRLVALNPRHLTCNLTFCLQGIVGILQSQKIAIG